MRRSIATVSMSGTLRDKLEAIARARFDGYEMFENDLIQFSGTPAAAGRIASDLGLSCELYQPFRDFEGMPDDAFRRSLDRAERKFDVMQALGARLMLVCSNTSPQASADEERAVAQLHALAERAARRDLRIGYEALAWGRIVNHYAQAWSIVARADHPRLGLIVDSFHVLSLGDDPAAIANIPGERIFFLQMADAPLLRMDVVQWARHHRRFPGQGQFALENLLQQVLAAGYTGPLSLEIFNDVFRETPNRRTARDAMRSLLYLEERVRRRLEGAAPESGAREANRTRAASSVVLFDPPATPRLAGIELLEFAVDDQSGPLLADILVGMGFRLAGTHRRRPLTLYRQGNVHLILNADPDSFARAQLLEQGPSVCAVGLRTDDPARARERALAMQCDPFDGRTALGRCSPAIRAPDGTVIYFLAEDATGDTRFAGEFAMRDDADDPMPGSPLERIDHVAFGLPVDQLDTWVLFCRAVLGMQPGESMELADPYGLIRSAGVASGDRRVRFVLNVSLSRRTRTAQTISSVGGGSVHHVAIACADIFDTVRRLRAAGIGFVPISANYYDDLVTRVDLAPGVGERMRDLGIMYDQASGGAYFHIYGTNFRDRFFFEIVQRVGSYDAYGALNAAARMASEAQSDASK